MSNQIELDGTKISKKVLDEVRIDPNKKIKKLEEGKYKTLKKMEG